jgi:hypothetical protein
VRAIWRELPEDDPIFTGGIRLVVGEQSHHVTADDEVEFISPSIPGRTVRLHDIGEQEG